MRENLENLVVLITAQTFFITAHSIMLTVASLVGEDLSVDKSLATLPLSTLMLGTVLATIPASMLMKYVSRRKGFIFGTLLAIIGAAVCMQAISIRSFHLFLVGTLLVGMFNGFCQLYRFAAAELVAPALKGKAISYVLAGGIIAGLIGPRLGAFSRDIFETAFVGPYLVIGVLGLMTAIVMGFLDMGPAPVQSATDKPRALTEIARQPIFIVAATSATAASPSC
jgi:predicted MFS family arabinose efflux permease